MTAPDLLITAPRVRRFGTPSDHQVPRWTGLAVLEPASCSQRPHEGAIETIHRGAARFVQVTEDAIAEAMRIYFDDTHQIAEGAGAAPLAALLQERERMANRNVGVILTGGTIERARLLTVLGGGTPVVG